MDGLKDFEVFESGWIDDKVLGGFQFFNAGNVFRFIAKGIGCVSDEGASSGNGGMIMFDAEAFEGENVQSIR